MYIRVLAAVVLSFLLTGVATSAAAPAVGAPDGCLVVGFTHDAPSNISTMVGNNSVVVGTDLTVMTDCGHVLIKIDDIPIMGGDNIVTTRVTTGPHDIEVQGDNFSIHWIDVHFFAGSDAWVDDWYDPTETIEVTSSSLWWDEIMAHGVTVLVIYLLSTTVVYKVAQYRIDRTVDVII